MAEAYGILLEFARQFREDAVRRSLPIPNADSSLDDGFPSEREVHEEGIDSMPDLTDTDDGPEHWRTVSHGNFLPCGLTPLEHVRLAEEASKVPVELNIPEDLLTNIRWLFNHSTATEHKEPQVDDVEHREMVDAFGETVVAEWRGKVSDLHQATIA